MKKMIGLLLALSLMLALSGCGGKYVQISIVIPAGSTEEYIYSEEEVSPRRDYIAVRAEAGMADTAVILKPVSVQQERAYEAAYLTSGVEVRLDAEKDGWFRIGVKASNPTDIDQVYLLTVSNVNVRIE